jgi:hypothetical protein
MEDQEIVGLFNCINLQLNRIADALEILARPGQDYSPNYIKPIEEYRAFNWASIQASVVRSDQDGPTHVSWNGQVFTRRSPVNKFEPAVWYSRASGKSEDGETEYAKLITFREIKDADPLPEKARGIINRAPAPQPQTPHQNGKPGATPQPAPQHANGKPGATQPTAPASQQPLKLTLVSFTEYLNNAKAKSITPEAAKWLAQKCEVKPEDDHSRPNSYLSFFYEAKHAGFKLSEAWAHLEERNFDVLKATHALPPF